MIPKKSWIGPWVRHFDIVGMLTSPSFWLFCSSRGSQTDAPHRTPGNVGVCFQLAQCRQSSITL